MNSNFDDDPCGPGSDCAKILEVIDRYIDGVASEQERIFINSHAQGCPDCKDGIEFEEKFHLRIQSVKPECMPQDFRNKLLMSFGFPGMTQMHSSISPDSNNSKSHFFKFFRKNKHTG